MEIRYRPLDGDDYVDEDEGDEDRDPTDGILAAVEELSKEAPGDILISSRASVKFVMLTMLWSLWLPSPHV